MKNQNLIFLLIVLIIASFFRLWQLDKIPPGLYPDVAIYGNDAWLSLKNKDFKVFYPENYGREGLFMWLLALSFSIFGISIFSLKIVPATIGILTVFGFYLLVKELFSQTTNYKLQATNIALLSSFFLAVSFWHTNFSRIGFRLILVPFVLVFSFYFLLKGFRNKKIYNFIISGIFFGLGFYTYISYRFIVFLLPMILLFWYFIYRKQNLRKIFILNTFYLILTIFFVALPIGIYFLKNPQDFIGRATPVSIFAAENPIREFFRSLILHLAMFNFYGDKNWRHNFSKNPMLFWPVGILFLIGIILSFREIFKKSNYQNKNYQLLSTHYFLLSAFFIMLLPGILTHEGIPHSLRVVGTIPTVYIFSGLGGLKLYQFLDKKIKRKKILKIACSLFLVAIFFAGFYKYFYCWGKRPEVEAEFTKRFANMGYFLNSLPEDIKKYVIVNEPGVPVSWAKNIPMPAQTIIFIENMKYGFPKSTYLLPENLNQIKIDKKTVILPMKYDQNLFNEILRKFPEGKFEEKEGFFVYKINF